MYEKYEHHLCQIHLRALCEWKRIQSKDNQPVVCGRWIHLTATLLGIGPEYRLQLQIDNITPQIIHHLVLVLHVTSGQLKANPPSKNISFLFPASQQLAYFHVKDMSGQGGQLSVSVIRHSNQDHHGTRGELVYSTNLDFTSIL